jgi:hypothetical protein
MSESGERLIEEWFMRARGMFLIESRDRKECERRDWEAYRYIGISNACDGPATVIDGCYFTDRAALERSRQPRNWTSRTLLLCEEIPV